jgi:histidinol-phosphate aminotransferase
MKFEINSLVRKTIARLKPYSSARDEFQAPSKEDSLIYLDANENAFNTDYNRYPDPHQLALKKKIAGVKGIAAEQIFLGNGSDEAIDLLIRAFCEPGIDNVIIPQPTYGMYSVCSAINNVEVKQVSLTSEFEIDSTAIEQSWNDQSKILFLCSPNNPSGNLLNKETIKSLLLKFDGLVVVDEAYIDFTDDKGFVPFLNKHTNLVILQTMSKAWGLAGLRLGMCFANPEVITILNKIKPPYNINTITQSVVLQQLEKENQKTTWIKGIITEREKLKKELIQLKIVKQVYPSDANFLLVRVKDAKKYYDQLILQGIIVRDRSNVSLCEQCLRITVGTPEENMKLIEAFKRL